MAMTIPLSAKKPSINLCREDLRVLTNLSEMNVVYAAKFLTNKTEDQARALLAALKNEEVETTYNLLVS